MSRISTFWKFLTRAISRRRDEETPPPESDVFYASVNGVTVAVLPAGRGLYAWRAQSGCLVVQDICLSRSDALRAALDATNQLLPTARQ